jgi:hypothetical protein
MRMTFEQLLPRLVTAYHQGVLVPFLGAGMSRTSCPDWATFIADLERNAVSSSDAEQATGTTAPGITGGDLIFRANAAIRKLSLGTPVALRNAIRSSLYGAEATDQSVGDAPQTVALAALWWPMVVSSNYDDLFVRAYAQQRQAELREALESGGAAGSEYDAPSDDDHNGHIQVLGRSRRDCARVLSALSVTVPTVLWAVHGYLPGREEPSLAHLANEMVVGHDEYRRIAHADPYYRRAFGELWRRRSLLFLGSSLGDPYLLDLFSEVQELHGTNPQPHYALVEDDKVLDEELLRTRFNIIVAQYGTYKHLPERLGALTRQVRAPQPRPTRFGWNYAWDEPQALRGGEPDLEIAQSGLPLELAPLEGMLLSAGFFGTDTQSDRLFFSDGIQRVLEHVDPPFARAVRLGQPIPSASGVFCVETPEDSVSRVAAIRPWMDARTRDLNRLRDLLPQAFDWAVAHGVRHLHMPLIGAGASRHFPASVPLAIIVRAHKRWCEQRDSALRLTVHVVEQSAVFELTSGRLNLAELLAVDDLRFWVEFESGEDKAHEDRFFREPMLARESDSLQDLAAVLGLPTPESWEMCAEPAPARDSVWLAVRGHHLLGDLGMTVGGTLRVRRRDMSASQPRRWSER